MSGLVRILAIGSASYLILVFLVRLSGKRTLAKMNAFDLIVTVALGSTLSTILLSKTVSLAEGITALALLIAWQYAIAWSSVRAGWVRRVVKSEPTLLFYSGRFLEDALRKERVTKGEVRAAIRSQGMDRVEDVGAVILETDGTFSVIKSTAHAGQHGDSALKDTDRYR